MEPTADELKAAEWIAAYCNRDNRAEPMVWDEYRVIVDFLAKRMCHEGATWKNRVLFKLTGCDAMCNYKD